MTPNRSIVEQRTGLRRPIGTSVLYLLLSAQTSTVHATRVIDSVSLNGGAAWTFNRDGSLNAAGDPVVASPFGFITVAVTVTTSGPGSENDWETTAWRIATTPPGGFQCADTQDFLNDGTHTTSFMAFAPLADGTYNAYFRAHDGNSCGGTNPSPIVALPDAIIVDAVPNPPLGESCGLDIVMTWDSSGSIDSAEYAQIQAALVSFVEAFLVDAQTPTEFALVEFASTALIRQGFTDNAAVLINEINEPRVQPSGGSTNWEQGLVLSKALFPNRPNPDLLIFASDGNPNRIGNNQAASEAVAVATAVGVADDIKSAGIRIVTVGIGSDLDVNNLVAISGPNVANGNPIDETTDVITADFRTLAASISELAFALCGGSITVCKVLDLDGNLKTTGDQITEGVEVAGFTFIADVTGGTPNPAQVLSGTDGKAMFDISIDGTMATVDLTEIVKPGITLLGATCTGATAEGVFDPVAGGVLGIVLSPFDIATCVFVNLANQPPVCDAGGPYVAACSGALTTIALDGTASGDPDGDELTYLWSTTCPGGDFDDSTSPTPLLIADTDPGCLIECDVTLVVDDGNGASDTCSASVAITDMTPPEPACPADGSAECGEDTSPAKTGIATATDECSTATLTHTDAITPGCGGTQTITRTWTATDDCGNAASCDQTITVVDTTPPEIACPADVTLECPAADTSPATTGMAAASEECNSATITFTDASVPGCGGTQTITRTWTATDDCGNSASCEQTITVVDTTPPQISCLANMTLVWGDSTDPSTTGMATAADDCDPAAPAIAYIDAVSEPDCLADPIQATITRTCTATDACGNAASCDQTLTLLKRPASLIIKQGACPAPLNRSSHGVLPALVTGDVDFDVTQIDLSSLRLSRADCVGGSVAANDGPPGPPILILDLNHPYVGPPPCSCNADQTGDGLDDLSLKFRVDDLVEALELDALPDGAIVELCVTGTLADGCEFRSCDCVRLVPPGTPDALLSVTSNLSGAWVGVTPLDNTLDGGGFTAFVRNFPETSVVTLTAEAIVNDKPLVGWMVDGDFLAVGNPVYWQASATLKHTLIAGQAAAIEALYGPPLKKPAPMPGPTVAPAPATGFDAPGKP